VSTNCVTYLPWFALYVKAKHEKCVTLALQRKGLNAFLPTHTRIHRNGKKFDLPLFPGYVFCRIALPNTLPVMTIPGVFSIVGTGREPQPILDVEIEGIQRMLTSGLPALPWPYIPPGREVFLNSGPLRGLSGVVVDSSDEKWLVISVHLLQRSVAVKVDRQSLPMAAISAGMQAVTVSSIRS
jgi:transcription termination/antitermination protein NusG